MAHKEHFRITMVDGGNFLTYVKDITRDCQLYGVMIEAVQGKLLDDMGPNAIEEITFEHLRERTETADVLKAYREVSTLRTGSEIMLKRDGVWAKVLKIEMIDSHLPYAQRDYTLTLEYSFSDGTEQHDIKAKGTELAQIKLQGR